MDDNGSADLTLLNSLSQLSASFNPSVYGQGEQLSQTTTLYINNRWYLISNNRSLLSQLYVEHGIVQTLVDQPVDDAFRSGFEIKSSQLSSDDVEVLQAYLKRNRVINSIMQACKWGRLFGGGGLLLITDQDPATPFEINSLNEKTPLEFRAVDMWELYQNIQNSPGSLYASADLTPLDQEFEFYDYYGRQVHRSRVFRFEGKEAPSFVRPRLRGWGMSELERLVRSINQYMKNQDVIFALLDEAKVDVFKMKGFNSALATSTGTQNVANRIRHANTLKNYNNALTMDAEDEYEQKEITFTGLAEMLTQIRIGIAADLKMPVTKLFGMSAAGFNSGEDDIENYNSMIEGEIRAKVEYMVVDVIQIACQKLFGKMPDDLQISFNPLRILNAKEEEEVKDKQFTRVMSAFEHGLATAQEAKESINKDSLMAIELDETSDALPPVEGDFTATDTGGQENAA